MRELERYRSLASVMGTTSVVFGLIHMLTPLEDLGLSERVLDGTSTFTVTK